MQFGTELPGEGTTWGSLSDVVLTPENLLNTIKPIPVRASGPTEKSVTVPAPSAAKVM
ncbi:hypothetical protein [Streptomyces chartreusis]|uniref:hypothetical protein n=1 Tax=Streptomyces chartreusis TaxID=1969 RepID=UPI00365D34F6